MRNGREPRDSQRSGFLFLFVATILIALLPAKPSRGSLITGKYELSWEQDVDKTATETTDIRKFKQTLELKYKGFLSPVVENEVSLEVEQEINSNAPDTTRFIPTLDLGLKGKFWDLKTGLKREQENSDEPGQNPQITTNYFVEFFYLAPKNVPDLKAKYSLDTDEEEGVTDTEDQEITLSSMYKPTDWLDMKGDYNLTLTDDKLNPDSDTEDERFNGTVGIRHFISEKIKIDLQYDVEISQGATLLDAGGETNRKDDRTHTGKSALSYRPSLSTDIDASYDHEFRQDRVAGEDTTTRNTKISASQEIGPFFDLKGEFNREIIEEEGTADDNETTEDDWTVELKAKLSNKLDFSIEYEQEDTDEVHDDPSLNTTSGIRTWRGTWTGELAPFWKASVSFDRAKNLEDGVITTIDTKYSLKSTFDFKAIDLTLDPAYDITKKEDQQITPTEETETRDFKFKIAWKVLSTRTMEAKFDHTYGRKTDSEADNIQRTDDTTANLTFTEPLPGWTFAFDLTRSATDTSRDDLEPDITSTFGFKTDYKRDQLLISTDIKYDKNSATDDEMTFDAKVGWTAVSWDIELTYDYNKTFSEERNEGYSISLSFQYNL